MITGIAHGAYEVRDMDRTLRFYCDQLGLKHVFSIRNDKNEPWIEYVKIADGQFLEFFYPRGGTAFAKGSYMHLCLEVDDIYETVRDIEARGVALRIQPNRGKDGNIQAWIDDPDGNPIELMQIDPRSPQANS